MEEYLRQLRQQFVGNTWQPLLGKAPISFGSSSRGMGAGRAAHHVFVWPSTGVRGWGSSGTSLPEAGAGLGVRWGQEGEGAALPALLCAGQACPLVKVFLLLPSAQERGRLPCRSRCTGNAPAFAR